MELSGFSTADVCFGSKADIRTAMGHVRFEPESGNLQRITACPPRANCGHRLPLKADIIRRQQAAYVFANPTSVSVSVSGGCKSRDKSTVVPVTPKSLGVTSSQPLSSAYRRPAM